MHNNYKYIILFGYPIGILFIVLGLLGTIKLSKEHKKRSNNEFLLEAEKPIQKRNIAFIIIGSLVLVIMGTVNLIYIILK